MAVSSLLLFFGNVIAYSRPQLPRDLWVRLQYRSALDLRPEGYSDRFIPLHSLPLCFSNRYDKQASVADLEEAIAFGRVALELCPLGHPDRSSNFNHLGYYLRNAFPKLGTTADLDEAFSLHWLVLDLRPEDHPSQRALIM